MLAKYALKDGGETRLQPSGDDALLNPAAEVGPGQEVKEPVLATWEEIIQQANCRLEARSWTPRDTWLKVRGELVNETPQKQAQNSSRGYFGSSPLLRAFRLWARSRSVWVIS
ncbi:hypothetical protein ACFFGR_13930 [Arthrobacter liuii]|uniref:Uncharacterized protein n=1 Tax=Arthrobacter liuii TaxID=1476996 RepID=A0ABQ2AWI8_9MICC|nr:hypothetical protein [Arthrobacter liuii]GGI00169.1 hypothetical protein GCM10007170_36690 [Arthrobacter liuii]